MKKGLLSAKDLEAWLRISKNPVLNWVCQLSTGFRNRMLGNPQFVLVLLIEQAIGISAKLAAEIDSRKDRFWKVSPFHLATQGALAPDVTTCVHATRPVPVVPEVSEYQRHADCLCQLFRAFYRFYMSRPSHGHDSGGSLQMHLIGESCCQVETGARRASAFFWNRNSHRHGADCCWPDLHPHPRWYRQATH